MTAGWLAAPARPGRAGWLAGLAAAVASGVLWILASPPYGVWLLGWLAPWPVAWAIDQAPTPRRAGLWGGGAALVFTVGGFHWMIYLLEVNAHLPTALAVLGLALLGGYHGLVFMLGARLTRALRDRRRDDPRGPWPMALCLPLGYLVVEVVVWTPFPFSVALGQAAVGPLRHLAAFASSVGIVAIMAAVAGAGYDALTRSRRRWQPAAGVAAFIVIAVIGSVRVDDDRAPRTITVGLVQPNARVDVPRSSRELAGHLEQLRRASRELEDRGADLVVWSETAYPFGIARDRTEDVDRAHPLSIRGTTTGPLLIGAVTVSDDDDRYNSAILVDPDGRFLGRDDKIHRMIGSEYNPLVERFPALEKYLPDGAGSYAGGTRPELLTVTIAGHPVRLAIMVCLEDVIPSFGRELAALDPDLIVNLTNDTWFDLDAEPHQHEGLARFRAVEVGVPMVRAVNTGPSSVIDRDGRIIARSETRRDGPPTTLLVPVRVGPRARSLYAAVGGPLTWGAALAALGWWLGPGVVARVRRRRARA
ncbi:MAG: apolipoprotein N-acyltransferase [Kofleriaceae bacterium]